MNQQLIVVDLQTPDHCLSQVQYFLAIAIAVLSFVLVHRTQTESSITMTDVYASKRVSLKNKFFKFFPRKNHKHGLDVSQSGIRTERSEAIRKRIRSASNHSGSFGDNYDLGATVSQVL